MITYEISDFNDFSIESYEKQVNNLPIHKIKCSCGMTGSMIRYGNYSRHMHTPEGVVELRIQRLKCCNENCGRTHALLPSSIIPHSTYSLFDQVNIINCYNNNDSFDSVMNNNPYIDENIIQYILKLYIQIWEQVILCFKISLSPVSELTSKCFLSDYHRPFLQTHKGINIYFPSPT